MGLDASMSEGSMSSSGVCKQGNGYYMDCFVVVISTEVSDVFVGAS